MNQITAPVIAPTRPRIGALYATLPTAYTALFFLWTVGGFILPVHIQRITGGNDATALGLANSAGALVAAVANPVFGQLSDRTRSRYGRRSPWILGCVVIGMLAFLLQANASSVLMLGISWTAVQTIMNGFQAAITAVMPDRVPPERHGIFSALMGLSMPLATVAASVMFIVFPGLADGGAYYVTIVVVLAAAILMVTASPDTSSLDLPREPFRMSGFVGAFFRPLAHADFRWAFIGRFGLMLGYMVIFTFSLFLLEDYIHVSHEKAISTAGTLMLVGQGATFVAVLVVGPLSDKISRYKLFALVSGFASAFMLAIPLVSPTVGGMIAYSIGHGVAFGVLLAIDMALIIKVLPNQQDAGKDMGVINISNAGLQVASPALAALLVSIGDYQMLFYVGIVVSLLGCVAIARIKAVR